MDTLNSSSINHSPRINELSLDKHSLTVVQANQSDEKLSEWIKANSDFIDFHLKTSGALLFRDFELYTTSDFYAASQQLNGEPLSYTQRTSPRTAVDNNKNIYTSTDYPCDQIINMHNESSYASEWPMRIAFFCNVAPEFGGETPIADVREVAKHLSEELKSKFKEKEILYVRNMGTHLGLPWQEVYQTQSKDEVEKICRQNNFDFQWKENDSLTVKWRKPAFVHHPISGEEIWFNHVFFYNSLTLPDEIYHFLGKDELPFTCYYGDGSEIEQSVIEQLKAAYGHARMIFKWKQGDLLILDNMLMTHGRESFEGSRSILVSMGKMITSTYSNLDSLVKSQHEVDKVNKSFYQEVRYPYPPIILQKYDDPELWSAFVNQDLGDFSHTVLPRNGVIWVAGCGSNQALITALKYPGHKIIGSDLSKESLLRCKRNAMQLNINNIELREESINDVSYQNQFDYVICTGVIHHNNSPGYALTKIMNAMKKNGILELMVYNSYHRIFTSAFQKTVRLLAGEQSRYLFKEELIIAKDLVRYYSADNYMSQFLEKYKDISDEEFADSLVQPIEHTFTVDTLDLLSNQCNLQILQPVIDQFSKNNNSFRWNNQFFGTDLQEKYEKLDDISRWSITNHLHAETSPMTWFYLQRNDSNYKRLTEGEICNRFLNSTFELNRSLAETYYRVDGDGYQSSNKYSQDYLDVPDSELMNLLEIFGKERRMMSEVLGDAGIVNTFSAINNLRLKLTTTAFPFLKSCRG